MNMNIVTPPKRGLKTRHYNKDMNMDNNVATLPKKVLKTRPLNMDMDKDIATLPKEDLKTRPLYIGMEKKGLKKYDYNIDMDMNTMTLPRKGLKTRHHNKDMNERGFKKYDCTKYMDMEKEYLKKLSKRQLIKLLLKQKESKKVSNHEDLLNNDQFKDGVAQEPAKPRTDRPPIPQVEDHIISVPVPKIKELNKALKGHAKSYGIELLDNLNPLNHFTKTRALVESHLENLLKDMKGFKFIEMLGVTFVKVTIDSETGKSVGTYKKAFFNSKAKTITKADDIEHELNMSRQEILELID